MRDFFRQRKSSYTSCSTPKLVKNDRLCVQSQRVAAKTSTPFFFTPDLVPYRGHIISSMTAPRSRLVPKILRSAVPRSMRCSNFRRKVRPSEVSLSISADATRIELSIKAILLHRSSPKLAVILVSRFRN